MCCFVNMFKKRLISNLAEWVQGVTRIRNITASFVDIWDDLQDDAKSTATFFGVGAHIFACVVFPQGSEVGLGTSPKRSHPRWSPLLELVLPLEPPVGNPIGTGFSVKTPPEEPQPEPLPEPY